MGVDFLTYCVIYNLAVAHLPVEVVTVHRPGVMVEMVAENRIQILGIHRQIFFVPNVIYNLLIQVQCMYSHFNIPYICCSDEEERDRRRRRDKYDSYDRYNICHHFHQVKMCVLKWQGLAQKGFNRAQLAHYSEKRLLIEGIQYSREFHYLSK